MRTVYLFFLFIFPAMFSSNKTIVNAIPYNSNVQAKSTEDVLMNKLFNLPEVKQLGRHVKLTHQDIATDLNSSREVISRLMKKMEKNGWIILHRNSFEWIKN